MHQSILTVFVNALPDIISVGTLETVGFFRFIGKSIELISRNMEKIDVKCLSNENNVWKAEILHPISYLERNSFLLNYKSGCSNVATWRRAGIYLCHDVSFLPILLFSGPDFSKKTEPLTIDSLEIGRLAHEANHGCWMSHFQAEILTTQNITVWLSRPM